MPKILGLNLIGVLAASVAFYFVGFLWYGLLFAEAWQTAEGIVAADVEGDSPLYMVGGFLITLLQVIGLGLVMKWKGDATPAAGATTAAVLWFFLALPFVHYAYLYSVDHSVTLLMIDLSHLFVGWVVAAVVLRLIK